MPRDKTLRKNQTQDLYNYKVADHSFGIMPLPGHEGKKGDDTQRKGSERNKKNSELNLSESSGLQMTEKQSSQQQKWRAGVNALRDSKEPKVLKQLNNLSIQLLCTQK